MPIATALSSLCELLQTASGAEVRLGRPDQSDAPLLVWPWRIQELPVLRNQPLRGAAEGRRAPPAAQQEIHALVFAGDALTIEGLQRLSRARQAVREQPVRQAGSYRVLLGIEDLPVESLTAVFGAAQLPLVPCLGLLLRVE